MLILATLLAFGLAAWVTGQLARPGARLATLDVPNDRSLHDEPRPRGGGLGVLAGWLASMVIVLPFVPWDGRLVWVVAGVAAIAAVSHVDDRRHVGVLTRLGVHCAAALLVVLGAGLTPGGLTLPGFVADLPWPVALAGATLGTVWLTNLYNFMDGMDGFAGAMAVGGFAALALMSGAHAPALTAAALTLAAAAGGFLVWNFPPARIFMGDVGASTLGFAAAALILWGDAAGAFPWWAGALAFSVFIADSTVTLVRRALKRERIWQAHRSHFYQRLVGLGWSHRRTLAVEMGVMGLTTTAAVLAASATPATQWMLVALSTAVLTVLMGGVTALEYRHGHGSDARAGRR